MELPAFRELPPERRAEQRARVLAAIQKRARRRVVLSIAVALTVLAAAPTLVLERQVVDFWSAEPAPGPVQLEFEDMRRHRADLPKGHGGHWMTVGQAREVLATTVKGEREPLWVVQNEGGGFCFKWVSMTSCARVSGDGTEDMKLAAGGLATDHGEGLAWVVGIVLADEIHQIELLYEDGEREKLPFVWVSDPIDAGFFAFEAPMDRQVPGRLTAVVVGLDIEGNEVAHHCLNTRSPEAFERSEIVRERCARPQGSAQGRRP